MANRRERAKKARRAVPADGGISEVRELLRKEPPQRFISRNRRMTITGFGGCLQVGRSCFLLQVGGAKILLDCGAALAEESEERESGTIPPTIPKELIPELQAVVLSHAHIDHSGYIPWLYANGCKAPLIATEATFAVMNVLCEDMIKLNAERQPLYERADIRQALMSGYALGYNQRLRLGNETYLTFIKAGHMLGSAQVLIEHAGFRMLYTGDISIDGTGLFYGAEFPEDVDAFILDCTYGVTPPRDTALEEKKFLENTLQTLRQGGTVIVPAFASSRAQRVLLTLAKSEELGRGKQFPVWVDGMIKVLNRVYLGYRGSDQGFLPDFVERAPWALTTSGAFFYSPEGRQEQDALCFFDSSPKVIVSTSGMVNALAAYYLEPLIEDPKNLLYIAGYQVRGSVGEKILRGDKSVDLPPTFERGIIRKSVGIRVERVQFSGHSTAEQTSLALQKRRIPFVGLVHGDPEAMDGMEVALRERECAERIVRLQLDETLELRS